MRDEIAMEQYLVQDLLEICGAMGISAGSAKTREAILEVMQAENVTAEEADEFWELVCEQKQKAEKSRKELEAQRHEQWKAEERRKRREHALRMKELDLQIQALKWEQAKHQLHNFQTGENITHFLEDFEVVCSNVGVSRDLWVEKLATLLPREIAHVLSCLPYQEVGDFSQARYNLIRYFFLSNPAESRSDKDSTEARRKAPEVDACRRERQDESRQREQEADYEGLRTRVILEREREPLQTRETPSSELIGFKGVGNPILSQAETASNGPEEKLANLSGALTPQTERSVLANKNAGAASTAISSVEKSCRREHKAKLKNAKRVKVAKRHGSRGAMLNVRAEVGTNLNKRKLKFRPLLRSRSHAKRVAKKGTSIKFRSQNLRFL
ncbi:uncharacterized protein LOC119174047 isoform X1 [Rhipicephalus microplus]|uniref:uncharacterized protein LOC119174047 isoform X1 n=1 Tax=Rhipicephalus microplus TaxID=6941 RepID=UPI003F6A727C